MLQDIRPKKDLYHVQHVDCASFKALVEDGEGNDADVEPILGLAKGIEYFL
jgi:hypothetical protein